MSKKSFMRAILVAAMIVPLAFSGAAKAAPQDPVGAPLVGNGKFCSAPGASIAGVGASFANNAHQKVFIPAFTSGATSCAAETVTYGAGGSGKGISNYVNRTNIFTGSDDPLDPTLTACADADLGTTTTGDITCDEHNAGRGHVDAGQHIPVALGAVTLSYNLTNCGITTNEAIKLRSQVISAIFSGVILKWNDQLLTVDNPNLASCNQPIKLQVRSDASGTTFAFKDYLSKRNPQWNVYKQPSENLQWPIIDLGLGTVTRSNGNGGVATAVFNTPGSLGYVELSATKAAGGGVGNKFALVDGPHGQFLASADTGVTANCALAAQGAVVPPTTLSPGWDLVSIADTPNPLSYPICTFTYILAHTNLREALGSTYNAGAARVFVDYLLSSLDTRTQAALSNNNYAPLPENIRQESLAGVALIEDQTPGL